MKRVASLPFFYFKGTMTTELPSTASIPPTSASRRLLSDCTELLGSMRFAISLLSLIAIASVIGTVLKQNEPMPNYVNQFGPLWFEFFRVLSLYAVYTSWWFLLILVFLVSSTSLCLIRNAPKMLRDMRSWRDNVREQSLQNFPNKAAWHSPLTPEALGAQLSQQIRQRGYQVKMIAKDQAILLSAKKGAANKLGYIFAHSAIIIILVGGMLDSELAIKVQQWFMHKTPFDGTGLISQIAPQHRLSLDTPTFRGNTMIPEGQTSNTAVIPQANGIFIQDLPFAIHLNKFIIDFYSTGMPKLFASEVELVSPSGKHLLSATIKVNEPLIYQGIAIYQSSFEDGGSKLQLNAYPMRGATGAAAPLQGVVGASTALPGTQDTIEWSGFRPFNVENMNADSQDVRSVAKPKTFAEQFANGLSEHSGSAAKGIKTKDLHNVGASVQYKLRDRTGQAREFNNYMLPVSLDGQSVFLAGMRDSPAEPFRYLRIPADDQGGVQEWMRLRAALFDPVLRQRAAADYARNALPDNAEGRQLRDQLQASAQRSLEIFAGDAKAAGFVAVSQFLGKIPAAEQERASEVFMKILNGSLWHLWQQARQQDGLAALEVSEQHAHFLQLASNALSDAFFYNAPVYLQLTSYDEVKASVLQVTRSPGKKIVYLGCLFLVLGIFSMFYIRERRLWVWIKAGDTPASSKALMALSTQRKTMDFEQEFAALKAALTQ